MFAGGRESDVRLLLAPYEELPVEREIAERAGRIRRETGTEPPDALIAATALHHRLVLVTRNVGDFREIRGLRVRTQL